MNYIKRKGNKPTKVTKQNHHSFEVIPGPKTVVESENGGLFIMISFKIYTAHMI